MKRLEKWIDGHKCKVCNKGYTHDCMLTNGVCVFCHYNVKSWNCNGIEVSREESHREYVMTIRKMVR